jgi:hypothetical protein
MNDRHQEFVTATGNKQRFRAASLDASSRFQQGGLSGRWQNSSGYSTSQENPNNSLRVIWQRRNAEDKFSP